MNGHLEDERISWLAFWACFITYVVICMTKNAYSTAIAAIIQEGLFTKSRAGLINTGFYLLYGSSQFAGGYLADKTSPVKLIVIGLIGSMLTNIVMAVSHSFAVMLVAWSLNGLMQFGIWPSILKIISTVVMPEHKRKAMTYISFAYCGGMVLSYGLTMPVLHFWRWPSLFVTSVVMLLVTVVFFLSSMRRVKSRLLPGSAPGQGAVEASAKKAAVTNVPMKKLMLSSGLVLLLLPALIRCMLDLGLKSWVPTMIMESYGVSPGFASILTTVLLFVNLSGIFLIHAIYPRRVKNLCLTNTIFFTASLPLFGLLLLIGKLPLMLVVLLLAVVTTFMYAGNQLFNVMMPTAFAPYGKTGTIAGILNGFACFGSMIASYLFGLIADHFGWSITIGSWIGLALIAVLMTLAAAPLWSRFVKSE